MNVRESVIEDIVRVLKDMDDPKPVLVTREPFDVEKLAITQFPAILVQSGEEIREDFSMRGRVGNITYQIRCFVRGTELDKKKNEIIERVEETLELDRNRGTQNLSIKTEIIEIAPVSRIEPLGEVLISARVQYKYTRGTT